MTIGWLEWGEGAARARAAGKPLLLSLVAPWCHACHRMDEETWEDPGVAAAVQRHTVPVRVDADARPDLYGRYHLGGLPTTALLTAEGEFVRGGTFLLPAQFLGFLEAGLADFASGRRPGPRRAPAPSAAPSLVAAVVERLRRRADLEHGGFGMAPKLPEPDALTLLLRRWRQSREAGLERILRLSLGAIAEHLADPVDGGFFRYAAAPDWTGPHTEKLALEQAHLIRLFLEAGPALGERRYVEEGIRALDFVRRRLADDAGGIFSSAAADPGYYGAATRDEAEPPPIDRRRFADAAAAVASAAYLGRAVAGRVPRFEPGVVPASRTGRIPHRLDAPEALGGLLRDQALAIGMAVDGYRLTGDGDLLAWGAGVADWALANLLDGESQAFRAVVAAPGEPSLPPIFPVAGNGEMARSLADLADHLGRDAKTRYRRAAAAAVAALAPRAAASPAGPALALAMLRLEEGAAQADLEGDPRDPAAQALARTVVGALGPTAVVRWRGGTEPRLVLCVGDLCLPSLGDPVALEESLVALDLLPGGILEH